jgi:hypothetical protein
MRAVNMKMWMMATLEPLDDAAAEDAVVPIEHR